MSVCLCFYFKVKRAGSFICRGRSRCRSRCRRRCSSRCWCRCWSWCRSWSCYRICCLSFLFNNNVSSTTFFKNSVLSSSKHLCILYHKFFRFQSKCTYLPLVCHSPRNNHSQDEPRNFKIC